jgi:hypothetical protein
MKLNIAPRQQIQIFKGAQQISYLAFSPPSGEGKIAQWMAEAKSAVRRNLCLPFRPSGNIRDGVRRGH